MEPENQHSPSLFRLRQQYDDMPKTAHGETILDRHSEIRPEWVPMIMAAPFDRWMENRPGTGEQVDIVVGRITGWHYWVKIVLVDGKLETAYSDWRLNGAYGGSPWEIR